jgi:mono/diheme cytochrome c family protein
MIRVAAILACLALPAAAQEADALKPGDAERGASLYVSYCSACHGPEGRGDGPMAAILTVLPTDLTGLRAGNGGVFPVLRAVSVIDGRDPLLAHGGVMPIFGDFFEGQDVAIPSEAGQPIMTSQPLADIVAWLETVQE